MVTWLVLFVLLGLIWSGCYFFLLSLPMMAFLQLGFRLLWQAPESCCIPMIWPPPLPDPPFVRGVWHSLPFSLVTCFPHQALSNPLLDLGFFGSNWATGGSPLPGIFGDSSFPAYGYSLVVVVHHGLPSRLFRYLFSSLASGSFGFFSSLPFLLWGAAWIHRAIDPVTRIWSLFLIPMGSHPCFFVPLIHFTSWVLLCGFILC